ncbi:unnamed protein product [Taenia asiatica]|uniref:Uncharacterized protein n=1 Tax=Taenia asiatica TaxID=60517 RepID=A0A0R3WCD3_TAEAS|nr:unnamed protein product [Taenia asiatica]
MRSRRGEARRGEVRRGEVRRGEARRGEVRRGEVRRGKAQDCCLPTPPHPHYLLRGIKPFLLVWCYEGGVSDDGICGYLLVIRMRQVVFCYFCSLIALLLFFCYSCLWICGPFVCVFS